MNIKKHKHKKHIQINEGEGQRTLEHGWKLDSTLLLGFSVFQMMGPWVRIVLFASRELVGEIWRSRPCLAL